jgi:hypothetical protein
LTQGTGIQNPAVVDLVTYDPKSGECVLIMTETRPWDGSADRVLELQKKINNYLSFALDGQMARQHPGSVGKPVRLQLDCEVPPDRETEHFIELVREKLRPEGIRFVVNLI